MSQVIQQSVAQLDAGKTSFVAPTTSISSKVSQPAVGSSQDSTRDAGRVHVGGGMMRF